jgi:hypothetical protein
MEVFANKMVRLGTTVYISDICRVVPDSKQRWAGNGYGTECKKETKTMYKGWSWVDGWVGLWVFKLCRVSRRKHSAIRKVQIASW